MKFKKYVHSIQEKKIYDFWEKNSLFKPKKKNQKKLSLLLYLRPTLPVNFTWVMLLITPYKMF